MRSEVCILQLCIFLTSENNDDREKLTRTEKVRMVLVLQLITWKENQIKTFPSYFRHSV